MDSRLDRLNAELASQVDQNRQVLALNLKKNLLDEYQSMISDDEAIIVVEREFERYEKRIDTMQNWAFGISFFFAIIAMMAKDGAILTTIAIIFGCYYLAKRQMGKALGGIMVGQMSDLVLAREAEQGSRGGVIAGPTPEFGGRIKPGKPADFDVPPQDD